MRQKLVLATNNAGKLSDLRQFITPGKNWQLVSLADFAPIPEPEETASDFMSNAVIKARYYAKALQNWVLGEDSGFCVEAFPRQFGVKTKRTITANSDQEWLDIFEKMMKGQANTKAVLYSTLALANQAGQIIFKASGQCHGRVDTSIRAKIIPGIPFSSVFVPDQADQPLSQLQAALKHRLSHRAQACNQLNAKLKKSSFAQQDR